MTYKHILDMCKCTSVENVSSCNAKKKYPMNMKNLNSNLLEFGLFAWLNSSICDVVVVVVVEHFNQIYDLRKKTFSYKPFQNNIQDKKLTSDRKE